MLNYQTPDALFNYCLYECGLADFANSSLKIEDLLQDSSARAQFVRTLEDMRSGAEAVYKKGKPSEKELEYDEWLRQWQAWSSARKVAFYSRAALLLLGDTSHVSFFLETLAKSHNIVFLVVSRDLLQHLAGQYTQEPLEELSADEIHAWWEKAAPLK